MKIIIAGAGIGGLTAALCLQKSGHEVLLFERAASMSELGAGIQCGANAIKVFQYLGLFEELLASSVQPQSVLFRDYQSGNILHSMRLGFSYETQYGAPYLHVHRADLQRALLGAVLRNDPDCLTLGTAVSEYQQDDNAVHVTTDDGQSFSADCLVGADGIKSKVRKQIVPQQLPVFSGYAAWRAVVDTRNLPQDWMDKVACNFVGPNKHAVLYYLREQKLANLVGVVESARNRDDETYALGDDSWVQKAAWEELNRDFGAWHETVQSIIKAVDKDQCYRWDLYTLPKLKSWADGRVALLGDAAHATLPFMASGAAMAVEDARILDRSLNEHKSVSEGLRFYYRNRYSRVERVEKMSRQIGHLYHLRSPILRKMAFRGISVFGNRRQEFLPEYDANQVLLV